MRKFIRGIIIFTLPFLVSTWGNNFYFDGNYPTQTGNNYSPYSPVRGGQWTDNWNYNPPMGRGGRWHHYPHHRGLANPYTNGVPGCAHHHYPRYIMRGGQWNNWNYNPPMGRGGRWNSSYMQGMYGISSLIENMPKQSISPIEREYLLHMREEEKLARDVYIVLYQIWGLPIFRNIANSEQRHMNMIKILLEKYNIPDPVEEIRRAQAYTTGLSQSNNLGDIGKFKNKKLQQLYNQLIEKGKRSIKDALEVGATIEDLDIKDLEEAISKTDNEDIRIVYENLMKGSRNHLRAFTSWLYRYGVSYRCKYISQRECEEIINTPMERGFYYSP
jgi:hypothetical protein